MHDRSNIGFSHATCVTWRPDFPRRAAKALGWTALVWLLCAIPFVTDSVCPFGLTILLTASFLAIGVVWAILVLVRLATAKARVGFAWWLVTPVVLMTGLALAMTDFGLMLRIAACETQLRAYVQTVPAETCQNEDVWVGLFGVDRVQEHDGAVYLYTATGFLSRHGVAYNPAGVPPAPGLRADHLFGPWYRFTWSF